jgi:hypothetical protein
MEWIAQFWPFGTSGLGIVIGGLIAALVVKFVAGLVMRLVSFGIVAAAVGFGFFPNYMPFSLPFLGGASEPKWVLVENAGGAYGEDVAYSLSETPKTTINGTAVCDKSTVGTIAVCGSPGFGVVANMISSGLPTDINLNSVPSSVCSYKAALNEDFAQTGGESKVYQCKY